MKFFAVGSARIHIDYLNRLILLDKEKSEKLVRHAFVEQRSLGLTWFVTVQKITSALDADSVVTSRDHFMKPPNSLLCSNRGHNNFIEKWDTCRHQNKKLVFYNTIKSQFGLEPYIELCNYLEGKLVAKWRMSAHKLNS